MVLTIVLESAKREGKGRRGWLGTELKGAPIHYSQDDLLKKDEQKNEFLAEWMLWKNK